MRTKTGTAIEITPSMRSATATAIQRMAYYSAVQGKGQRQQAAIAHCRRLGVDHTAATFEAALPRTTP